MKVKNLSHFYKFLIIIVINFKSMHLYIIVLYADSGRIRMFAAIWTSGIRDDREEVDGGEGADKIPDVDNNSS